MRTHPDTRVLVFLSDRRCDSSADVELDAVILIQVDVEHRADQLEHGCRVVGDLDAGEVDLSGWPASIEGCEQDSALEDEPVAQLARCQSSEEALE